MNQTRIFIVLTMLSLLSTACKIEKEINPEELQLNLKDWTKESHSNEVEPNYDIVFNQNQVNDLEITLSQSAWDSVQADMVSKAGYAFGSRSSGIGGGGLPPSGGGPNGGGVPPGGGAGALDLIKGDPIYVPASVKFNGKEWYKVGFRLKGNSSLSQAWGSGIYKLPFKLQFDEFEDQYPAIKNQRFYGFKEFSMSPGQGDNSLIKDKIVADLFRDAGIPSAKTAFYSISINFGTGLKYCGVYTMVEVIDDSMVKTQFGEDKGNIYKPESNFVSFNASNFEKKNNKVAADYSDIQSIIQILHDNTRNTNPQQWRTNLEKVFEVDHFLKYLAINNTIVNWDSYGAMAHNYYLYTTQSSKKTFWIPWDFNLSMNTSNSFPNNNGNPNGQGNGQLPANGGGMMGRGVSLDMTEVSNQWPLIRYLADDAVYYAKYKNYVKEFNEKIFQSSRMNSIIDKESQLIANAVSKETKPYSYLSGSTDFSSAISQIKSHISSRNQAVIDFLK